MAALLAWAGVDPAAVAQARCDAFVCAGGGAARPQRGDARRAGYRPSAWRRTRIFRSWVRLRSSSRHAANVREAVDGVARHLPYHTPGARLSLHVDAADGSAELRYELRGDGGAPSRQVVELAYAIACKFLRLVTQDEGAGLAGELPPFPRLEFWRAIARRLAAPSTLDQPHDALSFPSRLLDVAIDHGQRRTAPQRRTLRPQRGAAFPARYREPDRGARRTSAQGRAVAVWPSVRARARPPTNARCSGG